jgi:hypothetical protein
VPIRNLRKKWSVVNTVPCPQNIRTATTVVASLTCDFPSIYKGINDKETKFYKSWQICKISNLKVPDKKRVLGTAPQKSSHSYSTFAGPALPTNIDLDLIYLERGKLSHDKINNEAMT